MAIARIIPNGDFYNEQLYIPKYQMRQAINAIRVQTPSFGVLSIQFQCGEGVPTPTSNSDISWVPHHSTQFWHYLLTEYQMLQGKWSVIQDCLIPTTFKSQVSHKPRLHMCFWWPAVNWSLQQTLLGLQTTTNNSSGCYLYFWPACFKLEVPKTPTSGSTNF